MKEILDQLIENFNQPPYSTDICEARQDYQKLAGEIYEDDKSYESRVGSFLEWYLFDRVIPDEQLTPLETLINNKVQGDLPEGITNLEEFTNNVHGLFIIKKIRDHEVVALNLLDDTKYNVREPEGKLIFKKNELFEARIVLNNDEYYFTGNFCFHPKEAVKFIKSEIKYISKTRGGYLKELKVKNSQLEKLNSKLDKNAREVEKLNTKIKDSKSVEKIRVWNEDLESLKKVRAELMQQVSLVEAEKFNLEVNKLKKEINQLSSNLIQRLNYMNLKFERSRQIDLQDIYRN
ncbi:MAG: hypothetical protein O3A78_00765 [Nitrospinae bacterium]|nr:hypothetical protein [Nitrospinota bacterium]MDA1108339.1 hypothetical protein [Nitrospinota bacterium]